MLTPRVAALVIAGFFFAATTGCTSSSTIGVTADDTAASDASRVADDALDRADAVEPSSGGEVNEDQGETEPDAQAGEAPTNQRVIRPAPTPREFQSRGDLRRSPNLVLASIAELPGALGMALRPGSDSLFIALQPGFVVELEAGSNGTYTPRQQLILDVSDSTEANSERGLLGIAFSPEGDHLYAVWTDIETGANQLAEFAIDASGVADMASERLVLEVEQPARNHNGGQIAFGPDGNLYYGLGDGGASYDAFDQGQDPTTLLGTILRIDPRAQNWQAYSIPDGNPFSDGVDGAPEVWVFGLRNPWRFSFDRDTGDLWIADVGQGEREEVNVLWSDEDYAGVNLGWPHMEGTVELNGFDDPSFLSPIHDYAHTDGACSVTGGYVYRGEAIPSLQGTYVYGDYCSGAIFALDAQGDDLLTGSLGLPNHRKNTLGSFGEGPDGELYVLSLTGDISRIESLR